MVTYKDFSFDEALAEQTRFRNAQSVKIGRLNLNDLDSSKKSRKGFFSKSDSSYDSAKHCKFESNGDQSRARSENIF